MTVRIEWMDDAKTILVYHCEGDWTWEEVWENFGVSDPLIESAPHMVDVIFNLEKSNEVPDGAIGAMRNLTSQASDNWGLGVVTGNDAMAEQIVVTFTRINRSMGEHYRIAKDIDSAMQLIQEHRKNRT